LYPPFWAVKKRNRRHLNKSPEFQREIVSRAAGRARSHPLLHRLMDIEAWLRKWVYYPFGIRCLVTCRPIR
jgi:hypothetical protein